MTEPSMVCLRRGLCACLLAVGLAASASAQNRQPGRSTSDPASPADKTLTGKERLGRKWTDEQRIDNCHVPVEKRGTKPRDSSCAHAGNRILGPTTLAQPAHK